MNARPPEPPADARLITQAQLATLLQVGLSVLKEWDAARMIPGRLKVGRLLRYDRRRIERWLAEGCPLKPKASK